LNEHKNFALLYNFISIAKNKPIINSGPVDQTLRFV